MNDDTASIDHCPSGQGKGSPVPDEILGWNWGAFLLNWIWGIGNSTWIALLVFVPLVNLVMVFVLGAKGNRWAWQNRIWRDVAHFKKAQRQWAIAGLIIPVGFVGLVFLILGMLKGEAYRQSLDAVRAYPEVIELLGSPIQPGLFVSGQIQHQGGGGYAALRYSVAGPKGEATVLVRAYQQSGEWTLEWVVVRSSELEAQIRVVAPKSPPGLVTPGVVSPGVVSPGLVTPGGASQDAAHTQSAV